MRRVLWSALVCSLIWGVGPAAAQDKPLVVPKEGLKLTGAIAASDPKVRVDLIPVEGKAIEMNAKVYLVQFQGGKRYRLEMSGKEVDSFLVVQDAASKQLAFNDDGAGFPNALLTFDVIKGATYKVFAAAFRKTGEFNLTIKEDGEAKVHDVGSGLKLKGKYTPPTGPQNFLVNLAQGKTYVIDLITANPKEFDPFLRILDAEGKELAHDDDGGGIPNARLTFTPPTTGVYQLQARAFLNMGSGEFTLGIKDK